MASPIRRTAKALRAVHSLVHPLYAAQEATGDRFNQFTAASQYSVGFRAASRAFELGKEHGLSPGEQEALADLAWIAGITHRCILPEEHEPGKPRRISAQMGSAQLISKGYFESQPPFKQALSELNRDEVRDIADAVKHSSSPGNSRNMVDKWKSTLEPGRRQGMLLLESLVHGIQDSRRNPRKTAVEDLEKRIS